MNKKNADLFIIIFLLVVFILFVIEILKAGIEHVRIYQVLLLVGCVVSLYEKIRQYRQY
jgi:hypothetical protein